MEPPSRFFSALTAILFLAVCAWTGAYAYSRAETPRTAVLEYKTLTDSAMLCGIAVRSEQPICFDRSVSLTAEDARRIPAGGQLGMTRDGSRVCSSGSAVFFSDCDGYEYLSPAQLEGLTVDSVQALLDGKPQSGDYDGRLVAGYVWYYAALTEHSDKLCENGRCRVLFDGFAQPVDAAIIYLSPEVSGKNALLLRLTAGGSDYLSLRRTDARLVFSEYSGLAVPPKAVFTDSDGNNFVYTLTAGLSQRLAVDIIYQDEELSLIEAAGLREGMSVLSDAQTVSS